MSVSKFAALFLLTPSLLFFCKPLPAQTDPASANSVESEEDESTLHGAHWSRLIETDLVEEKFADLDAMAVKFRSEKSRFQGGAWKLTAFYGVLDSPHLTDKDTQDHLEHLRHWVAQRPESITARVALASSLHTWAWVARGNGMGDKVTAEGWRLFGDRIQESLKVLKSAANLHEQCPQWYSEMMVVGLAQSWDEPRMNEIFEQGIQFEPGYFHLYKQMANYLLPKWDGKPGEASAFAKTAADNVGGEQGDVIYFHIATAVIGKSGKEVSAKEMDWARIQRGYVALTAQYGTTRWLKNEIAYFAYEFRDAAFARQQFDLIGDHWQRSVWRDHERFERARDWAQRHS